MNTQKQENPDARMTIYESMRQVPEGALTQINDGRLKGKSSINTMWRVKKLTEVFGPCGIGWNYRVTETRKETSADGQTALFVDIMLRYRNPQTNEWSEEIPGTGGNILVRKEQRGLYLNDEAYKMAISDAISNAGKLLGLGADVYFANDVDNKYSSKQHEAQPAVQQPAPQPFASGPKQAAYAEGRGAAKPEMNKLHSKWTYSIAVIAASTESNDELRKKLETMYTITDSNFNELLRLAGRRQ